MTIPISAITSVTSAAGSSPVSALGAATAPTAPTSTAAASAVAGDGGFGSVLSNAMSSLEGVQAKADGLAVQAATGQLTNVQDYLVAANEASVATSLAVAVRNNAVQAFNQIMGMPV